MPETKSKPGLIRWGATEKAEVTLAATRAGQKFAAYVREATLEKARRENRGD
jgi:hypothetical protein